MFEIGIDIQDIEPFRKKTLENDGRFYERIFTVEEVEYCLAKADPAPHLAARFAAKEAVMKLLGPREVFQKDIAIRTENSGKPVVSISREGIVPEGHEIKISMSHSGAQAAAAAILYPCQTSQK